ncbi:MAG: hypothetical protein K4571_15870 [Deltaproteobacteria bacterium]
MKKNHVILLCFFFLFSISIFFASCSRGDAVNWKEYFRDDYGTYYYDKDSIHYPSTKKTIFGITVRNKEIVNVWLRCINKEKGESFKELITIDCAARKFQFPDGNEWDNLLWNKNAASENRIGPGDTLENLFRKVCPE